MNQLTTPAVIYKIMHYSDHSAVALAFSPEHGKLKLFIPRAYSKKGGFMTFVPGSITYNVKDSSDLHKFVSFSHDPAYYFYTQTPEIMMRMHIVFDFFDSLYHTAETSKHLWQLICRFDADNFRKAGIYTIYKLLCESGIMFELSCRCGRHDGRISLYNGELYCEKCGTDRGFKITADTSPLLITLGSNEHFRAAKISQAQEKELIAVFANHFQSVFNKETALKSVGVFFAMNEIQADLL